MYFLVLLLILGLTAQYVVAEGARKQIRFHIWYRNVIGSGSPRVKYVKLSKTKGDKTDGAPTLLLDIALNKFGGYNLDIDATGIWQERRQILRIGSKRGLVTRVVEWPSGREHYDGELQLIDPTAKKVVCDIASIVVYYGGDDSIDYRGSDIVLMDRQAFLVVHEGESGGQTPWGVTLPKMAHPGFVMKDSIFWRAISYAPIVGKKSTRRSLAFKIASTNENIKNNLKIALTKSGGNFEAVPQEQSLDVVPLGDRLLCFELKPGVDYVRYWKAIHHESEAGRGTERKAAFDDKPQDYSYERKWSNRKYECGTLTERPQSDSRHASSTSYAPALYHPYGRSLQRRYAARPGMADDGLDDETRDYERYNGKDYERDYERYNGKDYDSKTKDYDGDSQSETSDYESVGSDYDEDRTYERGFMFERDYSDSRRGSSTPSVTSLGSVNKKL